MNATQGLRLWTAPILQATNNHFTLSTALGVIALVALGVRLLLGGGGAKVQVPIVGVDNGFLSVERASVKSIGRDLLEWLAQGYSKYKHSFYQIRLLREWIVMIPNPAMMEEMRKLPDEVFSFREAAAESIQSDYTMGHNWRNEGTMLINLVRGRLTKSLAGYFPNVIDEITCAFDDEIKVPETGWTTVPAQASIMRVVCRTSNRIFLGLPLCRNPEYVKLNVQYTIDVMKSAVLIRQFPKFLRGFIGNYFTPLPRTYATAKRLMTSLVGERMKLWQQKVDDSDQPNDMLQWMIETCSDEHRTVDEIIVRILHLNFAAIHTTSMSFTHALYQIAAEPEKIQAPIRQEAVELIAREGFTKAAVEKLVLLDSVLREVMRFYGLSATAMSRKAMADYTFSDGTFIPKGTITAIPSRAVHFDSAFYAEPDHFDPFRFVPKGYTSGAAADIELPTRMVATSLEYIPFGHGKHACPGRFWAANEIKAMMVHLLLNYDVEMENPGVVPDVMWLGSASIPNRNARIRLRRREAPF